MCRALYTVVSSLFLMFVQRPPLEDILFTHFWIWVIIGHSAHDKLRTRGPESLNEFFRVLRRVRGRVKSGLLAQVRCSVYSTNQHCRSIASVAEFLLRTVQFTFVQVVSVSQVGRLFRTKCLIDGKHSIFGIFSLDTQKCLFLFLFGYADS